MIDMRKLTPRLVRSGAYVIHNPFADGVCL